MIVYENENVINMKMIDLKTINNENEKESLNENSTDLHICVLYKVI